jgi:hypothetical protein
LPGRPALLPDESLSSWFARTARANGLRPAELYRIVQPGGDRHPHDLDRHADAPLLHLVATKTGLNADDLSHATFRRWAGAVFESDDGLGKLPWLAPAGREGGLRCFGQQLCPWCLAVDSEPYLRLTWRLGFVTTCPKHDRLLLDRCGACGEPYSVLRQDARSGISCPACGVDARTLTADTPPVASISVQEEWLRTIKAGWRSMGSYGLVYSFAALQILSVLTRLLAGGRHAHALRGWIAGQAPGLAVPPETIPRAREGALLTPRARCVLVAMATWLMGEWPNRFVAAAQAVGLARPAASCGSAHGACCDVAS